MKHETGRFGALEYAKEDVIFFKDGLLGYPGLNRFLIRASKKTEPVRWLISVEEPVEFPIIYPGEFYAKSKYPPPKARAEAREILGEGKLVVYCLLVLPKNLTETTINRRAPIFVNLDTKEGVQYSGMPLNHQPVALRIYRELFINQKGES